MPAAVAVDEVAQGCRAHGAEPRSSSGVSEIAAHGGRQRVAQLVPTRDHARLRRLERLEQLSYTRQNWTAQLLGKTDGVGGTRDNVDARALG